MTTNQHINFPILELAGITKQIYSDGSGSYHYDISYLIDVNGVETVLNCYPSSKAQLRLFPLVTDETSIQVMQHGVTDRGEQSNLCIGTDYVAGDD